MSSTAFPNAPENASQPSPAAVSESGPEVVTTQQQEAHETEPDSELLGSNEEFKMTEHGKEENVELPVLPPSLEGEEKSLLGEIPDTDALSPWTSPVKEVREQQLVEGLGGEGGGGTEVAAMVEDEKRDEIGGEIHGIEETAGAEEPVKIEAEEAVSAEALLLSKEPSSVDLRHASARNDGILGSASFLQVDEALGLQAPPVYDPQILTHRGETSTPQGILPENAIEAEDLPAKDGQESTPVEVQTATESKENSEASAGSPIEEAANLETPPVDEMHMLVAEDSLPTEKVSFLQRALQADEASALQETPTEVKVAPTQTQRTEIPASDMCPAPNIVEFHTTHGSVSEDPDTFFMNVQAAGEQDALVPALPTTAEPEQDANQEADTTKDVDLHMEDSSALTDTTEKAAVAISISELLHLESPAAATVSEPMDLDKKEAPSVTEHFSSLIELPTSSVSVPDPSPANPGGSSAVVDLELPDAPLPSKDAEDAIEAPVSSTISPSAIHRDSSSAPSTELPKMNPASSTPMQAEASKMAIDYTVLPLQASPPADETLTQASAILIQANEDDAQPSEISSSPPIPKGSMAAPAKPNVTPSTSFAAPNESQDENGVNANVAKKLGKRKANSTEPKLPQTKTHATPKKTTGTAKGFQSSADESPNKDVLFEELKAMKIASIQARNASLEAEIAAKQAKLEEVTQELENSAAETVKKHIKLLHDYNDIRDVGQGLLGMIADNRGVRIGELYDEFGVGLKD